MRLKEFDITLFAAGDTIRTMAVKAGHWLKSGNIITFVAPLAAPDADGKVAKTVLTLIISEHHSVSISEVS